MKFSLIFALSIITLTACIKDDFVDDLTEAQLRITTILDSIELNSSFQFEAMYLNNIGVQEVVDFEWSSSNPQIVEINNEGLATAISGGESTIRVRYDDDDETLIDSILVAVGETTVSSVQFINSNIVTTSSYLLEGDFTYSEIQSGVEIVFADNYAASTALPGLFVYLSNNPNSIANAHEIGAVEVFSGSHRYEVADVSFQDYKFLVYFCKPFNVKVGDGNLE